MDRIDRERFDLIKRKHGSYASWAVWAPPTLGPKSNMGDLSIFDIDAHPETLRALNSDVVMVGLKTRNFLFRMECTNISQAVLVHAAQP